MKNETLETLRHILDARIDHAPTQELYTAWTSARDIIEYALADNLECLRQFDYLLTDEDCGIDDCDNDMGYDPYLGCYTDDC